MSAHMMSRNDIRVIITAGDQPGGLSYFHDGWNRESAQEAGQLLWDWNRRSVSFRYGIAWDNPAELPGPVGENYIYTHCSVTVSNLSLVALELLERLEYQACEHPGWDSEPAASLARAIRKRCISNLTDAVPPPCDCGGYGGAHNAGCELAARPPACGRGSVTDRRLPAIHRVVGHRILTYRL